MIAARRPRRITSSLPDTLKNAPFPVQTSRFNPIHVTESDEGIDTSAGVNTPSAALAHQARKSSGPSTTRQFSKKKMVAASKVPTATVIRKPLTMNIADFPALSRFTSKASSSRAKASSSHSNPIINQGISLDKSRHTATILQENADPNMIRMVPVNNVPMESVTAPTLGMFNPTVIPHILCIRPPDESDMPDKPIWSLNAKNVFDIKSAYASLNSGTWEPESGCWKAIWSLQVPQRLRIFLWLSHKAKLMTNVERCRRSLSQQALCPCCHEFPETLLYVFRDCKYVIGVWSRLLPSRHLATFYSDDFRSWLLSNVATTVMHPTLVTPWHLLFASTLWQIWKNRNAWVFNGTMSNVADTVIRSLTWARYYAECTFKAPSSHSPIRKSTHWQRPERGWVSLCTDGAVSATSGIGSVSGVFRKDDGSWFYGFNKSIGIMQPLQAELCGLFIGIQIAWDIGLKKLLIQSDSKEAIKLLNAKDAASNNCALVRSIARLRNLRWETSIQWIPRTGNEPADMLAKFNNLPCYNTTYFAQPPERLWPLLDRDALSIM
ncbi:hypothetical protein GQ457_07G045030 [Hibiscus cannabinus]